MCYLSNINCPTWISPFFLHKSLKSIRDSLTVWICLSRPAFCIHMRGVQQHYLIKKDESLRSFHWCLIRTLHNYPFLTDWKSINNFPLNELARNQHKKLDLTFWYFQGIPYDFPLLVWYAEYKKERQITMLTWYGCRTLCWTKLREPYHPSQ